MRVKWTQGAISDLVRLEHFLAQVAPEAAIAARKRLASAPDRLREYPRIGQRIEGVDSREVRKITVGSYILRYEVADDLILIIDLSHAKEERGPIDA